MTNYLVQVHEHRVTQINPQATSESEAEAIALQRAKRSELPPPETQYWEVLVVPVLIVPLCPVCKGREPLSQLNLCSRCNGTGVVEVAL